MLGPLYAFFLIRNGVPFNTFGKRIMTHAHMNKDECIHTYIRTYINYHAAEHWFLSEQKSGYKTIDLYQIPEGNARDNTKVNRKG